MSITGYTKLFSSIIASTIWREDDKTRIVWITLMAMADRRGIAEGSIPGLADFARVSIADTEAALRKLMAPDPYSRSEEYNGRRIERVDGGWLLLNHAKYRAKLNDEERREYLRIKQAEHRERVRASTAVNSGQQRLTQSEAEAEAERSRSRPSRRERASATADPAFEAFWAAYPRKTAKKAAERAFARLKPTSADVDAMLAALAWQQRSPQWTKDRGEFVPYPASWLNQRRWEDEPQVERYSAPRPDWREECERLHGSRCGNVTFHTAKMADEAVL